MTFLGTALDGAVRLQGLVRLGLGPRSLIEGCRLSGHTEGLRFLGERDLFFKVVVVLRDYLYGMAEFEHSNYLS